MNADIVLRLSGCYEFCIFHTYSIRDGFCLTVLNCFFVAPSPSSHMTHLMRICVDRTLGSTDKWFYVRPSQVGCPEELNDLGTHDRPYTFVTGDARELVFVAQMPNPKENVNLEYSRWFQTLLGLLLVDTEYSDQPQWKMGEDPELRLEVRMGYRTHDDPAHVWHELASATVSRKLQCTADPSHRRYEFYFACEPVELFELGSCDYPFYLLNIRIPGGNESSRYNKHIGRLTGLSIIEVHQNGGFTKVWLSMKTMLFPVMMAAVVWYWSRIRQLNRPPVLLEKCLFSLGIMMLFIDLPIEWLTLWFRMPFMLLLSDLRQGLFYAMLLSFWLIFAGEHIIDNSFKNSIGAYWKHLSAVLFGCACLLIFDACERGIHLTNPFFSIWSTTLGSNLAYTFIVLAAISACVYFAFLLYMIIRVARTINRKRSSLEIMKPSRRLRVQSIIYRFKFLMLLTLVAAALTVSAFIFTQQANSVVVMNSDDDEDELVNRTTESSMLTTLTKSAQD
ncbi:unnamed protein product [Soboliphyme baturini]|uniref:Protein wntless-like protein n=1 Tax=Soboliphyme baturini TaxID=241478 RepID=A0A183IGV3_9BILA|nr:unnamed protein product [Soboliphyme baturini]